MSKIYLIRHGQTDWNRAGKIQGMRDIPLNEAGREQARRLAEGMAGRPVARVFSSSLQRARETAQILADSQGIPLYLVKGLEEISYGDWEGMSMEEIRQRFPNEFAAWWEDSVEGAPPKGESQMDVLIRSARAMEAVKANMAEDSAEAVAVVSHGATICCILSWLLKDQVPEELSVANVSVTTIGYDPVTGICELEALNDVRHLGQRMM